jgi:hypothetical protein
MIPVPLLRLIASKDGEARVLLAVIRWNAARRIARS